MNGFRLDARPSDAPLASGGEREVMPVVDDIDLLAAIAAFERQMGFDVPGNYGGIIVHAARLGQDVGVGFGHLGVSSLLDHFMGRRVTPPRERGTAVLGCRCGDVACWPLVAAIDLDDRVVTWSSFRQPWRPQQNYRGFGRFTFDRSAYERAIVETAATF